MTRDALRSFVERYLERWRDHDSEAIAAAHAPNATVESPMFASVRGRAAIADVHRTIFEAFPDIQYTANDIVIDPPTIALFITFRATQVNATRVNELIGLPGAHKHAEAAFAMVLTVSEDGLIVRDRRIYDFTGLMVQVGALKAKPAKA